MWVKKINKYILVSGSVWNKMQDKRVSAHLDLPLAGRLLGKRVSAMSMCEDVWMSSCKEIYKNIWSQITLIGVSFCMGVNEWTHRQRHSATATQTHTHTQTLGSAGPHVTQLYNLIKLQAAIMTSSNQPVKISRLIAWVNALMLTAYV